MNVRRVGRVVVIGVIAVMTPWAAMVSGHTAPGDQGARIEPAPALTLPPELDDFYRPAADIVAAAQPGEIIRARRINPAFFGLLHLNVDGWQLLYRTANSRGAAIATVTTVLKPRGAAPEGGRKLLSYQIAEDSVAQYCAPSYVIQSGAIPFDYVNAAEVLIPIAAGIGQGWTVALPDYQGPNSAYGASRMNAQATLDGIRAVENFEPAQLSGASTPVALWGYSGGTIPTSFVPEIKDEYAPELNIVGVASGGVAAGDYAAVVRHNNGGLYAGLISASFAGLATEYPEMERVLRERVDILGQLVLGSKKVLCHPMGATLFPGFNYLGTFQGADPLLLPEIRFAIEDNSLGQRTPSVPVYFYHAQWDELIPIAGTDAVVDRYCRAGAPSVTYVREAAAEHISGVVTHIPGAFHWLRDRLNGIPAPSGCTITEPVTVLTDPAFGQALGEILPTMAQALVGHAIGQR
ncbi:lipase [Nocardia otitidiscaviarum]|uniref:lipase family protein n=1 Tax=Nocardia otitidiscaviarum TaxID=1823 RepID=UPI0005BBCC05|nr:lipase family protein [Nocardia otitidiscaviarum]MBF6132256.1 lipase [Nocardia otitidiscaviarum]MBF6483348.1 lipase [Nocardia otitidiscaviarum]